MNITYIHRQIEDKFITQGASKNSIYSSEKNVWKKLIL